VAILAILGFFFAPKNKKLVAKYNNTFFPKGKKFATI
jgi:hypothetical protein